MVSHEADGEQAHLAAEAHNVGTALGPLVDLARTLGESPDGYTLDELARLGQTLRGWAIRPAMAGDDPESLTRLTGRPWRSLDPPQSDT